MNDARALGSDGTFELVVVGSIAYVLPAIRPEYTAELQAGLRRRRTATLTGACACGGGLVMPKGPGRLALEHEPDCPACDAWLGPRLAAERARLGDGARA